MGFRCGLPDLFIANVIAGLVGCSLESVYLWLFGFVCFSFDLVVLLLFGGYLLVF